MDNKDKTLEELFATAKMDFSDNDAFIESLSKKLEKVEYVKQIHAQRQKQYKRGLFFAFCLGIVFSCLFFGVLSALPNEFEIVSSMGMLFVSNARIFLMLAVSLFVGGAILVFTKVLFDLFDIKNRASLIKE